MIQQRLKIARPPVSCLPIRFTVSVLISFNFGPFVPALGLLSLSQHRCFSTIIFVMNSSTNKPSPMSLDWSGGTGVLPGRDHIGPVFLMLSTPCFSIIYFHVVTQMDGNFLAFASLCYKEGFFAVLNTIWPDSFDATTWKMIGCFLGFELMLQRFLPGRKFHASITPKGNVPVYTANGMLAYFVTMITLLALSNFDVFNPALVYDKFGNILASMNIFAWVFCTILLLKGLVSPSTTDSGTTGSWIYDFYWGLDLYPNILGWDVKMFTNCRAGMMFWVVGILCFAKKNQDLHDGNLQLGMAVNIAIQMIYLSKFYYWEMGAYVGLIDRMDYEMRLQHFVWHGHQSINFI